jgi:hypothetical protein
MDGVRESLICSVDKETHGQREVPVNLSKTFTGMLYDKGDRVATCSPSRRYGDMNTHSRRDIGPFAGRKLTRIGDRFRSIMTSPFDTTRTRDNKDCLEDNH